LTLPRTGVSPAWFPTFDLRPLPVCRARQVGFAELEDKPRRVDRPIRPRCFGLPSWFGLPIPKSEYLPAWQARSERKAPASVIGLAAVDGFMDSDNADGLQEAFIGQRGKNAMAHVPSRGAGAEAQHPLDFEGCHALVAGQLQVNDAEPMTERNVRVLQDRPRDDREVLGLTALGAIPMPWLEPEFLGPSLPQREQPTPSGQRRAVG
jgi:hypothetical protein